MLRADLEDAAVAAAKAYGHAAAGPRHVRYAIARLFRDRPEVGPLLPRARAALEPRGDAHQPPACDGDARTLLDGIGSEADALAVLVKHFADAGSGGAPDAPGAQVAEEQAGNPKPAVATEAAKPPREDVATVLAELDALVGLASVKQQLRSVIAVVQANQERTRAGLAAVNPGLHLVFTGPPGTGKTTVARLVARLYAATGALPGSNFTEASRADLVAGYVGQTAMKTQAVIDRTRPGVLFVDEAYALTPHHESDFGAEAIATLVKGMEDHRKEFAVIVAGYGPEMTSFITSNPGLRSRFKTYIAFPDYSAEELVRIFEGIAQANGLALGEGVLAKAQRIFAEAVARPDFGNARFARSLFEQAYARMALRAAADGAVELAELTTLLSDDLAAEPDGLEVKHRRIGFGEERDANGGPAA